MGNIIPGDTIPVAGGNFFTLEDSAKFPMAGLLGLSPSPLIITGIGFEYQAALT